MLADDQPLAPTIRCCIPDEARKTAVLGDVGVGLRAQRVVQWIRHPAPCLVIERAVDEFTHTLLHGKAPERGDLKRSGLLDIDVQ
ncbi:hypothetical protein D3C79_794470 [compost metagenome]